MADAEEVQPLVCDNGSGMVKVCILISFRLEISIALLLWLESTIMLNVFSVFMNHR